MHIDRIVRDRLFAQIDELYDIDEWDDQDQPGDASSFRTFLRMFLFIRPQKRPSLGTTSDGKLVAAWFRGGDRLAIECHSDDALHFVLSVEVEGSKESASGQTTVARICDALSPYKPERWFNL